MDEKETENMVLIVDSQRCKIFCPMIKEFCREDCECYEKSMIRYTGNGDEENPPVDKDWIVRNGKCKSFSLKGPDQFFYMGG